MPACAAHKTPASPAKAEAIAKAVTISRLTSSPTSLAAPRSSAVARVPSPASVRVTNQPSAASDTAVRTTVTTLMAVKVICPSMNWIDEFIKSGIGKLRGEEVKIRMPRFSRM